MKSMKKRKLPIKDLLDREEEKPGLEQIYIEHAVAVD